MWIIFIACATRPSLHITNVQILELYWFGLFKLKVEAGRDPLPFNIISFAVKKNNLKCLPKLHHWIYKKVFTKYKKECFHRINLETTIPFFYLGKWNDIFMWLWKHNVAGESEDLSISALRTCEQRENGTWQKWQKTTWKKS